MKLSSSIAIFPSHISIGFILSTVASCLTLHEEIPDPEGKLTTKTITLTKTSKTIRANNSILSSCKQASIHPRSIHCRHPKRQPLGYEVVETQSIKPSICPSTHHIRPNQTRQESFTSHPINDSYNHSILVCYVLIQQV